jgi:hypothetical protein
VGELGEVRPGAVDNRGVLGIHNSSTGCPQGKSGVSPREGVGIGWGGPNRVENHRMWWWGDHPPAGRLVDNRSKARCCPHAPHHHADRQPGRGPAGPPRWLRAVVRRRLRLAAGSLRDHRRHPGAAAARCAGGRRDHRHRQPPDGARPPALVGAAGAVAGGCGGGRGAGAGGLLRPPAHRRRARGPGGPKPEGPRDRGGRGRGRGRSAVCRPARHAFRW